MTGFALRRVGFACVWMAIVASAGHGQAPDGRSLGLDTVRNSHAAALAELGPAAHQLEGSATSGAALRWIRLNGPIRAGWLEGLEARDVRPLQYLPTYAFLVHATESAIEGARQGLPIVDSGRFTPDLKIAPRLAEAMRARGAESMPPQARSLELIIQYFDVEGVPDLVDTLEAAGFRPRSVTRFGNRRHVRISISSQHVAALARWDTVFRIEPEPEYKLFGERSSVISAGAYRSGALCVEPGYAAWLERKGLTGKDVVVQVIDDGIEQGDASGDPGTAHPDLLGRIAGFDNATGDPKGDCIGGHGSINAGIIAGNATTGVADASGFKLGLGMAPEARVFGTKIFDHFDRFDVGDRSFADLARAAQDSGASISSNSWGAITFGEYDADAAEYDALVRDSHPSAGDQAMIYVFAAGNEGEFLVGGARTVGSPATAKNVISVGAAESCDADGNDGCDVLPAGADSIRDLASFSSRGPLQDGRLGVTLVATGTHVSGPASTAADFNGTSVCDKFWPADQTLYARSSGTSHSTPQVAGAAALLVERFTPLLGHVPSPAFVKAAVAASARDISGGADGLGATIDPVPSPRQGWGTLALDDLLPDEGGLSRVLVHDAPVVLADAETSWETLVFVPDLTRPLSIALAWTDAPGLPGASPTLVNDLDLEVDALGATYLGNAFADGWSTPGGEPDRINNLECVRLERPPAFCRVRVKAFNLPGDGVPAHAGAADQDFSLVIVGGSDQSSAGVIVLNARGYGCSAKVGIVVSDKDLKGGGTIEASLTSTTRPTELKTVLAEAPAGSGVFRGEVRLGAAEGQLAVKHGDTITAYYRDADDGSGNTAESRAMAEIDCAGPSIRSVALAEITDTTALITFKTDEPAHGTVQHGAACGQLRGTATSRTLSLEHSVLATGLQPGTKRFFGVTASDEAGNSTVDNRVGRCYQFTTSENVCSLDDDLEPAPNAGWTHRATEGPDAWGFTEIEAAHSPPHAWSGLTDGLNSDTSLYLPPLDISGSDRLSFWHAHILRPPTDGGVIEISTDGGKLWQDAGAAAVKGGYSDQVLGGPLGGRMAWTGFTEQEMSEVVIDLSRWIGPDRRIRLRLGTGESFGGSIWLLDDFKICHFINKRGTLSADRKILRCEDAATVLIEDVDLKGIGTLTVNATATPGGRSTLLTLTETGATSGAFSGTLALGSGEGMLLVQDGDRVSIQYQDADNGMAAAPVTTTLELAIDCTAPTVSRVRIGEIAGDAVTINWETDEPTTGKVTAGITCAEEGAVAESVIPGTSSLATLTGLTVGSAYSFKVTVADLAGNSTLSDAGGSCTEFTPVLLCQAHWDAEEELTGWTHAAQVGLDGWSFGDFKQAYTPPSCWFGKTTDRRAESALVSPEFVAGPDSYLSFWHTYELESGYDGGVIESSKDGGSSWQDLGPYIAAPGQYDGLVGGSNPLGSRPAWSGGSLGPMRRVIVSLSHVAGSRVQVRFRLGSDSSGEAGAWLVDDIALCRTIRERGVLSLDRRAYPCDGTIRLEMSDTNLVGAATSSVIVSSTSEPAGEKVTLAETPPRSGVFIGAITLASNDGPGILLARSGDSIEARATDDDDGTARAAQLLASAVVDCEPPRLLSARATEITDSSAVIEWRSEGDTTGQVELGGACGSLDRRFVDARSGTEHRTLLTGLEPGTLHAYRIVAADAAGNSAVLDNGGRCLAFHTRIVFCKLEEKLEPTASRGWLNPSATWQIKTHPLAHSKSHVWSVAKAAEARDAALVAPPIYPGPDDYLEFWHSVEIDFPDAGGVIEASTDDGETWVDLESQIREGEYDGVIFPPVGRDFRPAWTSDAGGPMQRVEVALDEFAGKRLSLRFRFIAYNILGEKQTWLIDDIRICSRVNGDARVAFSAPAYACQNVVYLLVADANASGPVIVDVTSSHQTQPTSVTLDPVSPGLFRANLALFETPFPGLLWALDGDQIQAAYQDPIGEEGHAVQASATARVDCTPPEIRDVLAEPVGIRSVLVTWTTSEAASGEVEHGRNCATKGKKVGSSGLGTVHQAVIAGLEPDTPELFKIHAQDEAGNAAVSDSGGGCFSFQLRSSCSLNDNLDPAAAGWTHSAAVGQDGWSLAASELAHSSTHVWQGLDSDSNLDASLVTPVFTVSPGMELSFWHTFGFEEQIDGAILEITVDGGKSWSDLGPWIAQGGYNGIIFGDFDLRPVWTGGALDRMTLVSVDLSNFAGAEAQARFRILCDGSESVQGWQIDDIAVCAHEFESGSKRFTRGNCASDDKVNLADAVFILNWLFRKVEDPACSRACDTNADDAINLTDAVFLLDHLFLGAIAPPAPANCGAVFGPSPIECESDACVQAHP